MDAIDSMHACFRKMEGGYNFSVATAEFLPSYLLDLAQSPTAALRESGTSYLDLAVR